MNPGTEGKSWTWILDPRFISKNLVTPKEDGTWKVYINDNDNGDVCIEQLSRADKLKKLEITI